MSDKDKYTVEKHQKLSTEIAQSFVDNLNSNVVAEAIIHEMATRQGRGPYGPEFKWHIATEAFRTTFRNTYTAARSQEPFDVDAFVKSFVDTWPEGEGVLRMDPSWKGVLAQPPYTENGLWPAFLRKK